MEPKKDAISPSRTVYIFQRLQILTVCVHHGANVRRDAREVVIVADHVHNESGNLEYDEEGEKGARLALREGEKG